MKTSDKILLEKIMRDSSPMEVLAQMSQYLKKESEFSRTGTERFGLVKISSVLENCASIVTKVLDSLREYQPKHRMYSVTHYSPRHAREVFGKSGAYSR